MDPRMKSDAGVRRRAMATVLAFGVVSLLADVVYEGARSILGPYLLTLGASATMVGLVSGAGEFAGYALRTATGVLADRTRGYWAMTMAGYGLTVVAVPLLGWVGQVELALTLVVAERLGKAIRSPARDALLADAAEPLGRGWGFGIHEALDQTGAVLGPLLLAAILALRDGDYRFAFMVLAIPGLLAMAALVMARRTIPEHRPPAAGPSELETRQDGGNGTARRYLGFVFFSAMGFAPFPLIAFHLGSKAVVSDPVIPMMFALAMAIDAMAALVAGRIYDRKGLRVLITIPVLSVGAGLAFTRSAWLAWAAMVLWGAVMGMQESTLRAAVGDLAAAPRRATAYGVFNTIYGIALLLGGVILGALYEWAVPALVVFIVAAQVTAAVIFSRIRRVPSRVGPDAG